MILDQLSSLGPQLAQAYPHLTDANYRKAFEFLQRDDLAGLAPDRYEIDGERVFAMVQAYTTHDRASAKYEAHRRYVDIQFVAAGRELIYWRHLDSLSGGSGYSDESDAETWVEAGGVAIPVDAGHFVVLYPHDAHVPGCHWDGPGDVKKVVVKVAL